MKKVYLIATFVAILAGIATFFFATKLQENTKIKDVPTVDVVVALMDIKENTIIKNDPNEPEKNMVGMKSIPQTLLTPGYVTKMEDVLGTINKHPIFNGEQILLSKIVVKGQEDAKSALSYQLKDDEYAYAISIDSTAGVAGFVSKGDYVDILYSITPEGATAPVTTILLPDAHVLRISNYATNLQSAANSAEITAYSEIIFTLNKAQILLLANKIEEGGQITLALKSITVGEKYRDTTPVLTTTPSIPAETTTAA